MQRVKFSLTNIATLVIVVSTLTGCATHDLRDGVRDRGQTTKGALIGGLLGAAAGSRSSDSSGPLYGAIAGALLGSAVGNYMDSQRREIEEQLANELAQRDVSIQRLQDETIKLSLNSSASFDVDSTVVKPAFTPTLGKLSDLMREYDQTALHIIGHTDSTGSESYNQNLSEQRASAVAMRMLDSGITRNRLNVEGRGELQPERSNTTTQGRRINRRVEIFIKPIVEGQERLAFESPDSNV